MTAGSNTMGSSHKSSSSSHRKSRWESEVNPNPDRNLGSPSESKPSKTSSNSKNDAAAPGPSIRPLDSIPSSEPGSFPPGGVGAPFQLSEPTGDPFPFPDPAGIGPPPPPVYGFHMLERRTIVLADDSVRSYFALPPGYQDFPSVNRFLPLGPVGHGPEPGGLGVGFDKHFPHGGLSPERGFRPDGNEPFGRFGGQFDYWNSSGFDGRVPPEGPVKRKYGDEAERDGRESNEFGRQQPQLSGFGNSNSNPAGDQANYLSGQGSPFRRDTLDSNRGVDETSLRSSKHMRVGGNSDDVPSRHGVDDVGLGLKYPNVDAHALKKAFLRYAKLINENTTQRKNYIEDGKHGPLQCLACGRASKDFPDMHGLLRHAFNSQNSDLHVDHLGLYKALCILMGWNYAKAPENSKAYQSLSADKAAASMDDLIIWPPVVIMHNTNSGKGKDGRMEGMGNKAMEYKLRDLGFGSGKVKSLYGKDGHLGITLVKFAADQSGLKEAIRLAEFFEKDNHGRQGWARAQPSQSGKDDENNPNLVTVDERTGEKKRTFYGYLGTAFDLDRVDFETRKKSVIESRREFKPPN